MLPTLHLDSTDSTSTHARRLLASRPLPFVVTATTQTAGRGQFSRAWSSPPGGLWCTFAFDPPANPQALGLRIGLACARTVEAALRRAGNANDARLKWPNDVYVASKKICGVLTEALPAPRALLVGVGINANFQAADLPPEIAPNATTILDRAGAPTDLATLLADLYANLQHALAMPGLEPAALAEARLRLHGANQPVTIRTADASTLQGILSGLNDDGLPLVRTGAGIVTATSLDPTW
jgi:BirA family biotin operon repressor/biotin-[acetyl-CoA-carboxylase] ligase